MIALCLLALTQTNPADAVLNRFDGFLARTPNFSVHIVAKSNRISGQGTGTLVFSWPKGTRFDLIWGQVNYTVAISEGRGVEIARNLLSYNEFFTNGYLIDFESSLGSMADYGIPQPFFYRTLKRSASPQMPFKLIKKANAKDPVDTVQIKAGNTFEVTARIDSAGRMISYSSKVVTPDETTLKDFVLTDYKVNPSLPKDFFTPTIPTGFSPFSLPPEDLPPATNESVPLGMWAKVSGGQTDLDALVKRQPLLLFLVDAEFDASATALRDLPAIRAAAKAAGVEVEVLVRGTSAADAKGLNVPDALYDPSGKNWSRLRVPGTPGYLLLQRGGKASRIWLGYDPDEQKGFLNDLKEAMQDLKKN